MAWIRFFWLALAPLSAAFGAAAESDTPTWRSLSLEAPRLPESAEAHPVDKFADAYFRAHEVTPAAGQVSDALFARRAYLDVWGLLPTPEQLDAFLADRRADKRGLLIDSLLADGTRYTHHWITFWNDHLRNDEGVVYYGERKSITPWLREALENNLPYDKFLQALLNPTGSTKDPAGFLVGVNWRGDINASQTPEMQAAQNSAQVFLGVNLKCNSCHDSFISRWKLKDAYGLASYFSPTPLEMHRCDTPTGQTAGTKFIYPELGGVDPGATLLEKMEAAARLFTSPANGRTPRVLVNRFWKVLFGRAITEPVDDMDARPWSPELLDWLAADFVANGYDMKRLLRRILTSKTYAMAAPPAPDSKPYVFRGPAPRRLSAEQFSEAISSITGEWRLLEPRKPGRATHAREWQLKSTALGRVLGRPIRDQVITERVTQPTLLQALELVNGSTLAATLQRGARRMLGELPAAPEPLFDSGIVSAGTKAPIPAKIDLTSLSTAAARKLWLVVQDVDSYDPARTRAFWYGTNLPGRKQLAAPVPSAQAIELPAGMKRFEASVGIDAPSRSSDINPRIRFFVFAQEPDPRQYFGVDGEPAVPRAAPSKDADTLIARVYRHALSRAPSPAERSAAREFGVSNSAGLEDFLWAVAMSPEFQFVR